MKKPQELIGKEVRGFKFEGRKGCTFNANMIDVVGLKGEIEIYEIELNSFKVRFSDMMTWHYPADQIEAHLVEDEEDIKEEIKQELSKNKVLICNIDLKIEDEIPTLSDGVMMLVSDDEERWHKRKVIGKKGIKIIAWYDNQLISWTYAKPLEPTKEEQLTAILGSSEKVSEIMELFKN